MALSRKKFLALAGATSAALATNIVDKCFPSETQVNESLNLAKILPERITANTTFALVAPASPIYVDSDFDVMLSELQRIGLKVEVSTHAKTKNGYLAGTDEQRASDLMEAFLNPNIDAILCIRGGWGCNRILPLLDFDVIKNNPKPLIGFSDITSLHLAIHKLTGLVTFHGPVGKSDWTDYTLNSFRNTLQDGVLEAYLIPENHQNQAFLISSGTAEGKLLGGNLTVLTSMIGSDYIPDFENSILFLEDVGEDIYRIDRMLMQLKLSGILDSINGFIFGKCTNCDAGFNSLSLNEVLNHYIKPLNIPAFYGAMISHEPNNATLPVGVKAEMNADTFSYKLLEKAVL